MKIQRQKEIVKADVLVVGGGIGGMQAAIAAAEAAPTLLLQKKPTQNAQAVAPRAMTILCAICRSIMVTILKKFSRKAWKRWLVHFRMRTCLP